MKTIALFLSGLSALAITSAALGQSITLFDNFGTDLRKFLNETNAETGDQITLAAGTPRTVNTFTFEYWLDPSVPVDDTTVRIRFYQNDGPQLAPDDPTRMPGTMFYDSGDLHLTESGQKKYILDNLDLAVPDTFTWSAQFSGGSTPQGKLAGIELYSPPTVGNDTYEFWERNGNTWDLFYFDDFPTDFGARIVAIPEPAPVLLLLLGVGLMPVLRRCRRL